LRTGHERRPAHGPTSSGRATSINTTRDITKQFGGMSIAHAQGVPQTLHQAVVAVFRDDPALAFDLARSVFGTKLPELGEVHDRKSELDRFAPCVGDTGELRPDLALSAMVRTHRRDRKPRKARRGVAMLLEVQRRVVQLKRWRIWVYWALLAEYLQLSTIVMVVALTDAVSRWAHSLGELEHPPRDGLLVLDRQNMPRITDLDRARQRPGMAVLSALLHTGDLEVLRVGFAVTRELPDERRWRYASALFGVAPESERAKLLGEMNMEERYQLTKAERNSIAYHDGRREGERKGERKGKREGKREGELEGELKGLVKLVLTILELREIPVSRATKARIRACKDLEQLERWAARAKRVGSIDELLK
jgi:hypothetical protein